MVIFSFSLISNNFWFLILLSCLNCIACLCKYMMSDECYNFLLNVQVLTVDSSIVQFLLVFKHFFPFLFIFLLDFSLSLFKYWLFLLCLLSYLQNILYLSFLRILLYLRLYLLILQPFDPILQYLQLMFSVFLSFLWYKHLHTFWYHECSVRSCDWIRTTTLYIVYILQLACATHKGRDLRMVQ